jgi:DNA (cytosine-5)-methyltransferase 1
MIRIIDLFTGIGGFSLAARNVFSKNLEIVLFCEMDLFCKQILNKNFQGIEVVDDIKELKASKYYGTIDILFGGFPCQPYSIAGKREGSKDDRALWPEMFRIISECKPTWLIAENVAGIGNMGQQAMPSKVESENIGSTTQNMVLQEIIEDLEKIGYDVQVFCIPACAVGAPHKRDRYWIVANTNDERTDKQLRTKRIRSKSNKSRFRIKRIEFRTRHCDWFNSNSTSKQSSYSTKPKSRNSKQIKSRRIHKQNVFIANANKQRFKEFDIPKISKKQRFINSCDSPKWERFPTQSAICRGNDGIPNRVDRIKALGNAIVPQVAEEIIKNIGIIEGWIE